MPTQIPTPLLNEIRNKRASLFLGAGASIDAGFPSSIDLSNYLIDQAGEDYEFLRGSKLDDIAEALYMEPSYGEGWVQRTIIDHLLDLEKRLSRPPSVAHDLMTQLSWRTIFTTNYDRVTQIAYHASENTVQNFLPIFRPDAQIRRQEESIVKYIHLNGSIEAAMGDVRHQLVLTFTEQNEARVRNEELYDYLRDEAINGPIVFIGFQFIHPGTSSHASDPSFEILKGLIRDIGTSRWHYCVTPYDENDRIAQRRAYTLEQNKIQTINATFSDFMQAVYDELKEDRPVAINERPTHQVPVMSRWLEISADDYESGLRHFQVLNRQIEEERIPEVKDALNGDAHWGNFLNNHYIERRCKRAVIAELDEMMRSSDSQMLIFGASAGWGKTFFWKSIAAEYYQSRHPVIWLNPYSSLEFTTEGADQPTVIGNWDIVQIDSLLARFEDLAREHKMPLHRWKPIIVADNCIDRAREVLSLFRRLQGKRQFVLIFSGRTDEIEYLRRDEEYNDNQIKIYIPDELATIQAEIDDLLDFCESYNIGRITGSTQRIAVKNTIRMEEANQSLILALQVIFDEEHRPFTEIVRDWWNRLDEGATRALVLRVAAFHRFGSSFYPRVYPLMRTFTGEDRTQFWDIYRDCIDNKGILFERYDDGLLCVATMHSLVAQRLMVVSEMTPEGIDKELIHVVEQMRNETRDLELVRRLLKQITDYRINLSSVGMIGELFIKAVKVTNRDWVVCHQFANWLLEQELYQEAIGYIDFALQNNPHHSHLYHTKGNIHWKWANALSTDGHHEQAQKHVEEARRYFAISRVRDEPDEYGYVTHLDMIRTLLRDEQDEIKRLNLLTEGMRIYEEGIKTVPQHSFNIILSRRFKESFKLGDEAVTGLAERVKVAVGQGAASHESACFLAQYLYEQGDIKDAFRYLDLQRQRNSSNAITWVKEAELHCKSGDFTLASRSLVQARGLSQQLENTDWEIKLHYWEMIISIARKNFRRAGDAISELRQRSFSRMGGSYPRGYIWLEKARNIAPEKRKMEKHAKLFRGRVEDMRAHGIGFIRLTDGVESMRIPFYPHMWTRRDFRKGETLQFAITIMPNTLRADDPRRSPFTKTIDDIYLLE